MGETTPGEIITDKLNEELLKGLYEMKKKSNNKYATGTGEWAKHNINIQVGCENGCKYCYAHGMQERFRKTRKILADPWSNPMIKKSALRQSYRLKEGMIMFPSTHDITPGNIDECIDQLKKMLKAGNRVLIVSKPNLECVERMCRELAPWRDKIIFRFTIGSADDAVLKLWEPYAPSFNERLESLRHAHAEGYETSVSCEPMLDLDIDRVIVAVDPYVTDTIWLGKANQLRVTVRRNTGGDVGMDREAVKLINMWGDNAVMDLYYRYKDWEKIRWKDSVKKVVGLYRPVAKGLNI